MKKHFALLAFTAFSFFQCQILAQITEPKLTEVWEPQPRLVTPGAGTAAPSDAIVLFDGKNMDAWTLENGTPAQWTVNGDGSMTVGPGKGNIFSKKTFGDCQLHIEWRTPPVVKGEGQGRGNSGIFFQGRYEVQVLDNFGNKTYANGQAASIYKQSIPFVNACRPPGEWQAYDIIFIAPRFNADGIRIAPGHVTVLHNGIVVQNFTEIKGTSEYIGLPKNEAHGKGPFVLQDHGDLVSYRNIWVREL